MTLTPDSVELMDDGAYSPSVSHSKIIRSEDWERQRVNGICVSWRTILAGVSAADVLANGNRNSRLSSQMVRGHRRGWTTLVSDQWINTLVDERASHQAPPKMKMNTTLLTPLSIDLYKSGMLPNISAFSPWDGEASKILRDADKTKTEW